MNPKISQGLTDLENFNLRMPLEASLDSDEATAFLRTRESLMPGLYHLGDKVYENSCFQQFPGYIASGDYGVSPNRIDIESEFRGLNYRNSKAHDLSKDPLVKFRKMETRTLENCKTALVPEYTKERRACSNISSIQQNRFDYPLFPLEVQGNDYIGENTRLQARDFFSKK